MIRIEADNLWARVTSASPGEANWLEAYLTVPVKGAEQSDAYQSGRWDGTARLFDARRRRFATGFVRGLVLRARQDGLPVALQDARLVPGGAIYRLAGSWLYPYQREALAACLARRRGLVLMPVASGKTEVFAALTQALRHCRCLILVDTQDLMTQAADRILSRTGERAGLCGDGTWDPRRVTVATVQTLARGVGDRGRVDELLEAAEVLIADEVHVAAAADAQSVAMSTPRAYYRLGFSATPLERTDESDYLTIGAFGPLVHQAKSGPLVRAGYVAGVEVFMVEHRHLRMTGTFAEVYEAAVILNASRNATAVRLAADPRLSVRPVLMFVRDLGHGRRLARDIGLQTDARADFLCGKDKLPARDYARKRLGDGRLDVCVVSKVWNKGVDVPSVASGVNVAGGASIIDAVQRTGRIARAKKGKPSVVRYYDFMDLGHRWLKRHAEARMKAYRSRGYRVTVVREEDIGKLAARK